MQYGRTANVQLIYYAISTIRLLKSNERRVNTQRACITLSSKGVCVFECGTI